MDCDFRAWGVGISAIATRLEAVCARGSFRSKCIYVAIISIGLPPSHPGLCQYWGGTVPHDDHNLKIGDVG